MIDRLREEMVELQADALLVTEPANVRYLSGFTRPEDGRVLVTFERAILLTDARYTVQASEESRISVEICPRNWLEPLNELVGARRLAFETEHASYALYQKLAETLSEPPVPSEGLVANLRVIKSPQEIETLRQAASLTDEAYLHILDFIRPGRRELDVALELERFIRDRGTHVSFEIIVASGKRSAMPHGVASSKAIEAGELVTLDFGAKLDGYHADMTRTVAVGEVEGRLREMYEAVLAAQTAALKAVAPGKDGKDIDGIARGYLAELGLGDYFAHGLGHGVGLDIHEPPTLSKDRSHKLEAGMTHTVEPGVYISEVGGVRIEDLVVVTPSGCERLSQSPKQWLQL